MPTSSAQVKNSINDELSELSQDLLSTLDESIFFSELSRFLYKQIQADSTLIYNVLEDSTAKLISKDSGPIYDGKVLEKDSGVVGYVIRTKMPYFSNNVERDPLFANNKEQGLKAQLCIPIAQDGVIIAIASFQSFSDIQFSIDDINSINNILSELRRPLTNLKMYLSAVHLNDLLLKKIELKDKELLERKDGVTLSESFIIDESEIIGKSDAMKNLLIIADKVATTDIATLIQGDRGTGKEMVARRIHCRSQRREHAFAVVNCAAMSTPQLEVELFGIEENGEVKQGLIELTDKGTLLLDNISKLHFDLQVKLLSFLKEGIANRVNGRIPFKADVRIVAATDGNLLNCVHEDTFRQDLYYSLNTMTLQVPALKERSKDIEILANYFLNKGKLLGEQKTISPKTLKKLIDYPWPGNVRELRSVMEGAYVKSESVIVEESDLEESVLKVEKEEIKIKEDASFKEMTLNELEKRHICMTLEHLGGNKAKTARTLGITVKTLYNKLHSYGMIEGKD